MSGSENESQVRCGEWELVQEIGRGAYGVVYRALGPGGARAAVKVCRRGDVGTNGGLSPCRYPLLPSSRPSPRRRVRARPRSRL